MGTHPTHGIHHGTSAERIIRRTALRKAAEESLTPAPQPPADIPHERIARRAYEIYEARGDAGGDALSDWLTAERELRQRMDAPSGAPAGTDRQIYH